MKRKLLIALVLAGVMSSAGCQSALIVKVEKIDGVQTRKDDGASDALVMIYDALAGLDDICTECRLTYGDAAVEASLAELADAQRKGRALLPLVQNLLARRGRGEIHGAALAAQVAALQRRASQLMPRVDLDALRSVIQIELAGEQRDAMQRLADDLPGVVARYSARLDAAHASASAIGFGGFRQGGVYQINPGDPAYAQVLSAKAAANPIMEVTVAATGDTGVMLVQESPAQLRLYQLGNDPAAIMHNAGFILNKVLQSAVKFSGVD